MSSSAVAGAETGVKLLTNLDCIDIKDARGVLTGLCNLTGGAL